MPNFAPFALAAALLCSSSGVAAATENTTTTTSPAAHRAVVHVSGKVRHDLRLTLADLAKYSRHTAEVSYEREGVPQHHTFAGALLLDVLAAAGPKFRAAVKNDSLRYAIVVTGSGHYIALLSWGEIDPKVENKQVLLALSQDGMPLKSPRLVVPGDLGGGRYVSDVGQVQLTRP